MNSIQKIIVTTALSMFATVAYAEAPATKESTSQSVHEDWSKMPSDMKDAERDAFKAKWEAMSPDEKKAFHESRHKKRTDRRDKMKEKWESASPEERAKMKEAHKERRAERREKMKEKWESASPEEREKMKKHREHHKEMRQERRAKMKEVHDGHDKMDKAKESHDKMKDKGGKH